MCLMVLSILLIVKKRKPMNEPKVLTFDIETFGGLKAHMSEVSVFGYKWRHEKNPVLLSADISDDVNKRGFINDEPLLRKLSEVWNEADVVIAHYGERFDRRFLNTRIERHDLPPLKPVTLIDTWRISKDNFALPGNSLKTLLKFFHSPYQKDDLSYEEWRAVQLGNKKALKHLEEHCKYDVLGLEWVFENHLSHYTNKLPNYNLFVDENKRVCPVCGHNVLQRRGFHITQTTKQIRYQCRKCSCWSRGPINNKGIIR